MWVGTLDLISRRGLGRCVVGPLRGRASLPLPPKYWRPQVPYRLSGKTVQVKRASGWKKLTIHKTVQAAKRHLKALRANVKH
jgi:hypothetical protein